MCCLLARTTLTINGGTRNCFGKTCCKNCVASNVQALFAHLHNAAHDDVFNEMWVNVVALNECLQCVTSKVNGVPVLQATVALAKRCTECVDDDCVLHDGSFVVPSVVRSLPCSEPSRQSRETRGCYPSRTLAKTRFSATTSVSVRVLVKAWRTMR